MRTTTALDDDILTAAAIASLDAWFDRIAGAVHALGSTGGRSRSTRKPPAVTAGYNQAVEACDCVGHIRPNRPSATPYQ